MAKVAIKKMRTRGAAGKVKAFFTVAVDDLEIDDMRLIVGSNGPFVGFPSKRIKRQDGSEDWLYIVRPARDEERKTTPRGLELADQILQVASEEFERRTGESLGVEKEDDLPF